MSALRPLCSTMQTRCVALVLLVGVVSGAPQRAPQEQTEGRAEESPRAQRAWDGRPAPGPYPAPPEIDFPAGEAPPAPAPLGRDSAVVGRLTQEGQSATLTFEAEAGELSLFDFTAYGYARGWDATSMLVVRDAEGATLAELPRKGPAVFSDFLPFTAPRTGAYTVEVVAAEHYFRYLVVRHSSYPLAEPDEVFTLADTGDLVVHGWTGGGPPEGDTSPEAPPASSKLTFMLRGEPGAPLALRAEPTIERGRKHKRSLREGAAAVTAGLVDARRLEQRMDPRLRDDRSFPDLTVQVVEHGETAATLAEGAFSALVRFPASGAVLVTVVQASPGPGGLFDLTVERSLTLAPCTLFVGDKDGEPVADVDVVLLREPALERVGRGKTAADGTVTLTVPPGDYTVVYRAPGAGPTVTRTKLDPAVVVGL